jgi:hypothetical protein
LIHVHGDPPSILWTFERDSPADERKQSMVVTDPDSRTRIKLCAPLPDDNSSRLYDFTAIPLDAEAL